MSRGDGRAPEALEMDRLQKGIRHAIAVRPFPSSAGPTIDEDGFTTAELLGNAALGIAALVAIWAVMQALGVDVVAWIRGQLRV